MPRACGTRRKAFIVVAGVRGRGAVCPGPQRDGGPPDALPAGHEGESGPGRCVSSPGAARRRWRVVPHAADVAVVLPPSTTRSSCTESTLTVKQWRAGRKRTSRPTLAGLAGRSNHPNLTRPHALTSDAVPAANAAASGPPNSSTTSTGRDRSECCRELWLDRTQRPLGAAIAVHRRSQPRPPRRREWRPLPALS